MRTPMIGPGWTDERVERLKTLWAEGKSCSEIAKDLRWVTRNAVIGKISRLGLARGDSADAAAAYSRRAAKLSKPKPEATPPKPVRVFRPVPTEPGPLVAAVEAIAAGVGAVVLMDLKREHCRFPVGAAAGAEQLFCGRPREHDETAWCSHHRAIAHVAGPKSVRRDPENQSLARWITKLEGRTAPRRTADVRD